MELSGKHDVVVIGSGAGGAAAAWRLATQGVRVLLLEAGPWFDPASDYRLSEPGWERRYFPTKAGSQAEFTFGDLGVLAPEFRHLRSWSAAGSPFAIPDGGPRGLRGAGYSHVQGVGGSTLHFVGEAQRLHKDAFRMRDITSAGVNWPISYEDLAPYYELCENLIGVAGDDAPPNRPRAHPFPLPAHPLSPGAVALQWAGEAIGQNWHPNTRAALSRPYNDRPACNYCGQCSRGCPLGDKGSADVTYIPAALETGNLEIAANAPVTRLIAGRSGFVSHVKCILDGAETLIETPQLVLAAGAVQTPRLLLLSRTADHAEGIANSSGYVGRNFCETLTWLSTGLVQDVQNSHMGLPADAVCWDYSAPNTHPEFAGGFTLKHATQESGLTGPLNYAERLLPGFGKEFKSELRTRFGTAVSVAAVGQVIPDERSRISLDRLNTDRFGDPVAQISSVLTNNSLLLLRKMAQAGHAP